jgi:hypothetical protein
MGPDIRQQYDLAHGNEQEYSQCSGDAVSIWMSRLLGRRMIGHKRPAFMMQHSPALNSTVTLHPIRRSAMIPRRI